MTRYHLCGNDQPIRDRGTVELASEDLGAHALLGDLLGDSGERPAGEPYTLQYRDRDQLLNLLGSLQRRLSEEQAGRTRCRISYEDEDAPGDGADEGHTAWMPIPRLAARVGEFPLSDYILHRAFTSYVQPIVYADGHRFGFELLLRPLPELPPFRPAELFRIAREAGLHSFLDREARRCAVRLGAIHFPRGIKRFINFLPSSIYRPISCLQHTFEAIRESGTDPDDCVFEVVETERMDDVPHLLRVFETYRKEGIRLALDDLGEGFATDGLMERLEPDYVKIDRKWVSGCHRDSEKQRHIADVLNRAARFRGTVLAEGVEREEEWRWLRGAGVSLLQGYLFGRPAPVPLPDPALQPPVG